MNQIGIINNFIAMTGKHQQTTWKSYRKYTELNNYRILGRKWVAIKCELSTFLDLYALKLRVLLGMYSTGLKLLSFTKKNEISYNQYWPFFTAPA